ncbi:CRAL TRIO domain protein [Seminavis robusta]|uniref:CRAL TRIO domain protein n=1 Tax=Seminavis robusta TaxID=568900 RepID=A0A9N8F491_9STRA|nr:CRAL TRIO domain protein [Seminavis robusta]|eukprot:Sro4005_g352440.1 CRAL TRIO domain protein (318) ;mRNA; f:27-980
MPNLVQRAKQVSWGGPQSSKAFAQKPTGGRQVIASFVSCIMKWQDKPKFPFRLCGDGGFSRTGYCAYSGIQRKNYKPWLVHLLCWKKMSRIHYHRGFSPAAQAEKHAIVWLRLGHYVKNDLTFFRGIIHAADRATGESLVETGGSTGKFNAIIDCGGFSLAGAPTIASLKQFVTMLQDHYPNRWVSGPLRRTVESTRVDYIIPVVQLHSQTPLLNASLFVAGMIYLVNLSRPGQIMLSIILRIITKEVRDKIKVLPNHNPAKSLAILKTAIEERYIPDWLGGTDTFQFSVEEYYPPHLRCTEDEAREFLTTMPYHAK